MVDRSLVRSGFDIEVLLSERYLRYTLLAQIEAGLLPAVIDLVDPDENLDVQITLHPPADYQRLYDPLAAAVLPDPVDGSFTCQLLLDDTDGANLQVDVVTDILDRTSGTARAGVTVGLMLAVTLAAEVDDRGFERNHRLSLALVKLAPLTQLGLALADLDVADITARIRAVLDRTVPFGVASGQSVQQAVLRPHPGDANHAPALGAYINLALKTGNGPDAFLASRGDVLDARNFLDDGRDLAFSTSAALFGRLGPDTFFRMAEEDPPGSGIFRHPLREDPGNPESDEIGTLKGVTIGPEHDSGGSVTGRLLVNVHGEYQVDILPDPDFNLLIFLEPKVDQGLLSWESESKVDVHLLDSLLGIASIIVVSLLAGPGAGALLLGILFLVDLGVDALASALAADRLDAARDATFLDALPHRVAVAQRRWDPFYRTDHQVVALVQGVVIDELGMAFDGDAVLDKAPAVMSHVVVRDESRDGDGHIDGLRYRVRDLGTIAADLAALAPGTDRRDFALVDAATDPRSEANLVALTLDQAAERIGDERIVHPVLYLPSKIHLTRNTIDAILIVSRRERDEQRAALVDALRAATDAEVRASQGAAIIGEETERLRQALGRDPTPDEIAEAVDARVLALVDQAQQDYEAGGLEADLTAAVDRILRLDARPNEIAALQDAGILVLAGKEIIRMRNGTVYFRDHPDFVFRDNLLALPHYHLPYQPPP